MTPSWNARWTESKSSTLPQFHRRCHPSGQPPAREGTPKAEGFCNMWNLIKEAAAQQNAISMDRAASAATGSQSRAPVPSKPHSSSGSQHASLLPRDFARSASSPIKIMTLTTSSTRNAPPLPAMRDGANPHGISLSPNRQGLRCKQHPRGTAQGSRPRPSKR